MSYEVNNPDNVYLSETEIERRKRWREAERRKLSQIAQYNILGNGSPERSNNGGYRPPLYNSSEPPVPQYQNNPPSNYPNYNDRNVYSPSRDMRRPSNYNEPISSYPIDNYGISSLPSNYNNNNNPIYDDNRGYSSLNRPSVGSPYSRNANPNINRPTPISPNRFSPLQNDPPNQQQPSYQQQQQQQQQQPLGSGRSGQTPTSYTRYRIDRLRPEEREALLEKQQKQKQLADVLQQQMEENKRKKEEEKRKKIEEDRLYNLEMQRQAEEDRLRMEEEKRQQEMKDQQFKRQKNIQLQQQQQQQQQQKNDIYNDNQYQPPPLQQQISDRGNISYNQDINQNNTSFSPTRRNLDYIPSPTANRMIQQQPQPQQPIQYQSDLYPPSNNDNIQSNLYPPPQVYNSPPQQQQQALAAGLIPPPQMGLQNGIAGSAPGYYMNPMMYAAAANNFLYPAQMILENNKIIEELKQKQSHEKEIMEIVKKQTELIMQLQKKTELEVKRHSYEDDDNPKNLSDSYIPNIVEQQQQKQLQQLQQEHQRLLSQQQDQKQSFSPKRSIHQSELPSELFKTPPATPSLNKSKNNQSLKTLQQQIMEEEEEKEEPINTNLELPPSNYDNNNDKTLHRAQSPILSPKGKNNQILQSYSTVIQTTDSPALFTGSRPPTSNKFEQSLSNFSELKPVTPMTNLRPNIMGRTIQQQRLQSHLIPIEEQSLAGESKFNPSETSVGESSLIGSSEFQELIEEAEEIYNKTKTNSKISPINSAPSHSTLLYNNSFKSSHSKANILTPNTLRENGKTLLSPPRIYDNKNDDNDDDDSDFSSDFEDMDPISRTLTFKMPKVKSPASNSSTIKINTLKPEEKVKVFQEPSHSFLSPHPKKPKTPQNDSNSPKYFKTMTDKMTITGEFRSPKFKSPRRPNSIM